MNTTKYLKQYLDNGCFDYLIGNIYWAVPYISSFHFMLFDTYGSCVEDNSDTAINIYSSWVMLKDGFEFLTNDSAIEETLVEQGESQVNDIKVVIMDSSFTFLYIRCEQREYLMRIFGGTPTDGTRIPDIECFKLYTVDEVMKKIETYENNNAFWEFPQNIFKEKAVYEKEALSLNESHLLLGNEKGLDLLKPLTRAEAVTLLVRALGLDSETSQYSVSSFSDIPSNNWASPYASLARAKGIAYGVSDTEFAPNAKVTADQFASFTLRAMGEGDFDYTQGIEILIDKGIITDKDAETMDLFTRGDMAKIVYEARAKGLL